MLICFIELSLFIQVVAHLDRLLCKPQFDVFEDWKNENWKKEAWQNTRSVSGFCFNIARTLIISALRGWPCKAKGDSWNEKDRPRHLPDRVYIPNALPDLHTSQSSQPYPAVTCITLTAFEQECFVRDCCDVQDSGWKQKKGWRWSSRSLEFLELKFPLRLSLSSFGLQLLRSNA